MTTGEPRWTIAELGERVSAALAEVEYEPPANGQVRAVPDLRTIRYYTTLGLLDRPAAMKGRTALYGPRHLLQLVAVKRLQAEGRSLSEVQAALTGLDDEALAAIARVPGGSMAGPAEAPEADAGRRAAPFWTAAPSRAAAGVAAPAAGRAPARLAPAAGPAPAARPAPAGASLLAKIQLAPGVTLFIEPCGSPGSLHQAASIDPIELARAAAPLVEALRRHGLAAEDPPERPQTLAEPIAGTMPTGGRQEEEEKE
jgi:DNA-binding transcriptional MerR regulator